MKADLTRILSCFALKGPVRFRGLYCQKWNVIFIMNFCIGISNQLKLKVFLFLLAENNPFMGAIPVLICFMFQRDKH